MLKIGELTSGLFAGDKLIAGKEFDWSKLYDALTYLPPTDTQYGTRMLIIANLSSHDISLYRSGRLTIVESGKIDWYSNGVGSNIDFDIQNESNGPVRYLEIYKCRLVGSSDSQMEINENICQPSSAIQSFIAGDFDDLDYVLFVFDYNE
ncbi:hypothetical protein [Bacteroides stercoris]|uniref:hypothetical protein n=1 Tax=Bacteroides stercoris TaxID=46506 RepID=UPI0034A14B8B